MNSDGNPQEFWTPKIPLAGTETAPTAAKIEPEPLPDSNLLPVPSLKDQLELLPDELRGWIVDATKRLGSPMEFVAASAIVGLGSLMSAKVKIQPKRYDTGFVVSPNVWGAAIGAPSSKKTPGAREGLCFLNDLERAEGARVETELKALQRKAAALKARSSVAESAYKDLLKKAAKGEDVTDEEIARAEEALDAAKAEEEKTVTTRRFTVNDATVEALGAILSHSPGVLQFRDEMSGWINGLNREDRANDRSFFLEAFNGSTNYQYDRIGRGNLLIPLNILSVYGGIQRDKIKPLVERALNGSNENDGLIQRFQMMVYPDYHFEPDEDRVPDQASIDQARAVFFGIAGGLPKLDHPIRFDDAAQERYSAWRLNLQKRVADESSEMSDTLRSHLGKYEKLCCSLALIFTIVGKRWTASVQDFERAAGWCAFLEEHAKRVYGIADTSDLDAARILLQRKDRIGEEFAIKPITQKGWEGLNTTDAVKAAVEVLIDYGHLVEVRHTPSTKGGRPPVRYRWTV